MRDFYYLNVLYFVNKIAQRLANHVVRFLIPIRHNRVFIDMGSMNEEK